MTSLWLRFSPYLTQYAQSIFVIGRTLVLIVNLYIFFFYVCDPWLLIHKCGLWLGSRNLTSGYFHCPTVRVPWSKGQEPRRFITIWLVFLSSLYHGFKHLFYCHYLAFIFQLYHFPSEQQVVWALAIFILSM